MVAWMSSIEPDVVRREYSRTSSAFLVQTDDIRVASTPDVKIKPSSCGLQRWLALAKMLSSSAICAGLLYKPVCGLMYTASITCWTD